MFEKTDAVPLQVLVKKNFFFKGLSSLDSLPPIRVFFISSIQAKMVAAKTLF